MITHCCVEGHLFCECELLGVLGLWACEIVLVSFCECCLFELWVLINVVVLYIIDSGYFCWRECKHGVGQITLNIVVSCGCSIFLFMWMRLCETQITIIDVTASVIA